MADATAPRTKPLIYDEADHHSMQELMDWQIIRSAKSPGPGAYNPDSTLDSRLRGGRFSKGNPKTDVDWSIYAASQKPGPGQYQIKGLAETTPGGRLGKGKAKGSLDWVEYVSMQIPSPQDYGFADPERKVLGGAFGTGVQKTALDWEIYRAKDIPAPHDYETNRAWDYLAAPSGGRFGKTISKSNIEMIEIESRTKPGPGAHDVERAFASISKHGDAPNLAPKIGRGKVTNFIDEECYRKKDVPAPHDYQVGKSFEYLEGRNGRAGAILLGRGAVPLPQPFSQYGGSSHAVRHGPSADHNKSLTPWRDGNSSGVNASGRSRPASVGGAQLSREDRSDAIPKGPSSDHTNTLTPWRHDVNFWKVPKKQRSVNKSWTCVMREEGNDTPKLATPLRAERRRRSSSRNRMTKRNPPTGGQTAERQRQQRVAAFEAESKVRADKSSRRDSTTNSGVEVALATGIQPAGSAEMQMVLQRVPVERIVRLERPEPVAGGWAIHVWVRAGRKARRHAVVCPNRQAAEDWVTAVKTAPGFGAVRFSASALSMKSASGSVNQSSRSLSSVSMSEIQGDRSTSIISVADGTNEPSIFEPPIGAQFDVSAISTDGDADNVDEADDVQRNHHAGADANKSGRRRPGSAAEHAYSEASAIYSAGSA